MLKEPTPEYCRKLLQYIPQRPDYPFWIEIIAAVGNTFSESVALDLLLSRFTDELPLEHAHKLRLRLNSVNFGTLVYYARQNGYKGAGDGMEYTPTTPHTTPEPDPVSFADADESSVLINDKGERIFRLAINLTVKNKTTDFEALTNNYQNVQLTLSDIADVVKLGHALCPAQLIEGENRKTVRNSSNFLQSEVIILDMDFSKKVNGEKVFDATNYKPLDTFLDTPAAEPVALAYTSYSHTPEHNRYRLFIPLPYLENNPERYKKVVQTFIEEYKADTACSGVCNVFYGNTNASIYNLVTGEVYHA